MEAACGAPFADSYLSGAVEMPSALIPKTRTAWERLKASGAAMRVLKQLGIGLLEPPGFRAMPERTDLTEAEYQYLTLSEKIRHHRMCAIEADMRAGPMWKGGRPVGPEALGARWHENKSKACNHQAEAMASAPRNGCAVRGIK